MANTRIYRSLTDSEGNAITGQQVTSVPAGESISTSPNIIQGVEVQRLEGTQYYATGEYYLDIPTVGLWDIYVSDGASAPVLYQERQWVGGVDLVSGGFLGFTVFECISPIPNDGSPYLASFPATGLDAAAALSAQFATPGVSYDPAFGLQRDYNTGMIVCKILAPVNEGVHIVYFDQGGVQQRTIFRVVNVMNAYSSPIYNFLKNPEFSMGSANIPTYWSIRDYFTTVGGDKAQAEHVMLDPTTVPKMRLLVRGRAVPVGGYGQVQPNDASYLMQTAEIGPALMQPQKFTLSANITVDNITDMSFQMSLVAIQRIAGGDTVLYETPPVTITSTGRASKTIDAPIGTTHIRAVMALVSRQAAAIPLAGTVEYYVDIEKAKLNAGLDTQWYA